MSSIAMSLKAKIKNLAKSKDMSAQVILQNYMFERFLERISKSQYKNKFILKGGMLIAAMVGIDNRSTMDMDATIKGYPLNEEALSQAIKEICEINVGDDVIFSFVKVEAIREDDDYGGFRVSIKSMLDTIITPMQIGITTGDAITPKEILYSLKKIFEESTIDIWAYNIESVLAEKYETILRRGEFNTRPRDFYDVYILTKSQDFDRNLFHEALLKTAEHRGTQHIFDGINKRIATIGNSKELKNLWSKYRKNYNYAKDISYEEILAVLDDLMIPIK
ncbi:nucleotidyl transferase AbiEii/AbiGii toxin family protein [Haloimpatiens sp. FM7315]|uniref:nucleotidyl transferase AbiEii/AbiGii toxin family protein n=1 Tax=Haloimpatiens sp. FM7315 TaxID=3298609 RepID=UPI0035A2E7AF